MIITALLPILFNWFFFFDKGENKKLCTTQHIALCQGMLSVTLKFSVTLNYI